MTTIGDRVLLVGEHPWSGFAGVVVAMPVAGPRAIAFRPGTQLYEIQIGGEETSLHTVGAEAHDFVEAPAMGRLAAA